MFKFIHVSKNRNLLKITLSSNCAFDCVCDTILAQNVTFYKAQTFIIITPNISNIYFWIKLLRCWECSDSWVWLYHQMVKTGEMGRIIRNTVSSPFSSFALLCHCFFLFGLNLSLLFDQKSVQGSFILFHPCPSFF